MSRIPSLPAFLLLAAMACAPAGAAEPQLGRLFFTPQQRAALDAGRQIAAEKKSDEPPRPARPRGPREIELNGIVTRSDGERTVWVNGKPYYGGAPRGVEILTDPRQPAAARIRLPGKRAADLRVGQRLEAGSGEVHEKYLAAPPEPQTRARAQRADRRNTSASAARTRTRAPADENGEPARTAPAR